MTIVKMLDRREISNQVGALDRFYRYYIPEPNSGCWLWLGTLCCGYGLIMVDGTRWRAHRYSWTLHNGPIPDGLFVCHRCDIRECVNPSHLFLGTCDDNLKDMVRKGRSCVGEKHGRAKLTVADVVSIRADGRYQKIIASEYGVHESTVGKIKRRVIWGHI